MTVESTIRRPVEVVSAYAAELLYAPEWYDNITSAEWKTEPEYSLWKAKRGV